MIKINMKRRGFFHLPAFERGGNVQNTRGCSVKKVFSETSQNSPENTVPDSRQPATLLKRRVWHSRFPVNFAKSLTPPFLAEHLRQLLLLLHFLSSLLGLCYFFIQEKVQTNIKGETLRGSRSQMFFKIAVLKDFAITVKKHLYLSAFLISLQAYTPAFLLKRESTTGVFLRNF